MKKYNSEFKSMIVERKKAVEEQIQILENILDTIEYKCCYYKAALEAGVKNS